MIGRALIRRGGILFGIDVVDGGRRLVPVSSHDAQGDYDRWEYRLNLAGPDSQAQRTRRRIAQGVEVAQQRRYLLALLQGAETLQTPCRQPLLQGIQVMHPEDRYHKAPTRRLHQGFDLALVVPLAGPAAAVAEQVARPQMGATAMWAFVIAVISSPIPQARTASPPSGLGAIQGGLRTST